MVIDASVVADAVVRTDGPGMRAMMAASSLEAPELFVLEVVVSLRNRLIREMLSADDAGEAVRRTQRLPIIRHPLMALADRVWELRDNLTAYDAAYVALAERLRTPLLTADGAIGRAPGLRCKVRVLQL